MRILGFGWVGTRTDKVDEMRQFCKDVLGMTPVAPADGESVCIEAFGLPTGETFEVVGEEYDQFHYWGGVKVEFAVANVAAARAEMEEKGVKFINPIEESTRDDGTVIHWTDFIAPDGHMYGLYSRSESTDSS